MNYITNTTKEKENGSGSADNTAVRRPYRLYSLAAAFFTALAFFMFAGSASAAEQRCNELGANCVCSEPLNNQDNLAAEPDRHWNPSDSVGKECDGENGGGQAVTMPEYYQTSSMVSAATEVPFPSGANPYVYRTKLSGIQHLQMDAPLNVDEETVCVRTYRRYSPGVYMTDVNNRIKNLSIGPIPLGHVNVEHNWDGTSAFVTVVDPTYGLDGSQYDDDFQQACQADWCRIEICADQSASYSHQHKGIFL